MSQEFRKLNIDLPRQPLVDQRPWEWAGILLVLLILVFAIISYYNFSVEERFMPSNDHKSESGKVLAP